MAGQVTIDFDPNVRTDGNGTFTRLVRASGAVSVGQRVTVVEPESGMTGSAEVTRIDPSKGFVFLAVDWASLHDGDADFAKESQSPGMSVRLEQSSTVKARASFGECVHLDGGAYLPRHQDWAELLPTRVSWRSEPRLPLKTSCL